MSTPTALDRERIARRQHIENKGDPFDLKNPDVHSNDSAFGLFETLLENEPIRWNAESGGKGFWSVCRYSAVKDMLRRYQDFSADLKYGGNRIFDVQETNDQPAANIFSMDPPDRVTLRQAIAPWFTKARADALQPKAEAFASELVSDLRARGGGDMVAEIAKPYVLLVAENVLGLPRSICADFLLWGEKILFDDDDAFRPSVEERFEIIAAIDVIAREIYEGKRPTTTGLFEAMRDAELSKGRLSFLDFSANVLAFFVATTDTTRHTLGYAVEAFEQSPEARMLLESDPAMAPLVARELIRWVSPVMHFRRTATRDCELDGRAIAKGQKVVGWITSANRDRDIWVDGQAFSPERFVNRDAKTSLAFGTGSAFCLGWRFAEMMVATMLLALVREAPDIRTDSGRARIRSNFMRGYRVYPVRCKD